MVVRLALVASSYSLLFLLVAIRMGPNTWLGLPSALLFVLGLVATGWILLGEQSKQASSVQVRSVEDHGSQVSAYLMTYLLPFVAMEPTGQHVTAYTILLVVVLLVIVQTDLAVINPLLYAFRWRLLRIETDQGTVRYLLSRNVPEAQSTIRVTRLTSDLLIHQSR